jgi:hypothetical protein
MPTQVMRSEFDTDQFAGFDNHHSGSLIGNRKYPITGFVAHLQRVFTQSIRHFLRDEHKLIFLAAFGFTQDKLAVLQIAQLQFQHFTDAHATTGHQFEDQSIANFSGAENYLVNGFLFDDFPSQRHPLAIKLANHGPVAWISELGIDIVADEIEERSELGITDSLGVGFVSFGEAIQERKDLFR